MQKSDWLKRTFPTGLAAGLLPFLLERQEGTAVRMDAKVKGISDELLSRKLDNKWSVKENIAHLAEMDEVALRRLEQILSSAPTLAPAVPGLQRDYNVVPVDEIIALFRRNRAIKLQRFRSLRDEDFLKTSVHPRLNITLNPVDLAFFESEHDDHHLVRVSEIINTLNS
ncbi:DinB family protein [Chryseolinea lacunae]|uniref:DinB family protein n=1 Tax=Chryseolinea lacunae TaxID=2801331 RepID=A0ABS1KUT3_9BACT|nr:DinB family protein [Chryseolinea lacunae]MBL0743205.1 DinB family protein [Chryseolinea lacunae]